jgi:endo-1,4-beta-xylanase
MAAMPLARAVDAGAAPPSLRALAAGRFRIGAALPSGKPPHGLTEEESNMAASQFDSVTPENSMKWHALCPEQGDYRFDPVDALMDFAKANRQTVVGHTLVFNREGNFPDWLFRDGSKEADGKLVWNRLEEHVVKVMTRYQGRIDSWDVLNEFVEVSAPGYRETPLTRAIGADFPERLFKLAAGIDPKAKMVYNDFGLEMPNRRAAILRFVRGLIEKGCRIDVIGSQSHLELGMRNIGERIDATIKECANIGVKSAFTELDVDVIPRNSRMKARGSAPPDPYRDGCPPEILESQARFYREVFDAVMANHAHVDRVTFWGFTDRRSWLNHWPWERVNHGLLFDRELRPKPSFHAVADALRGPGAGF